MIHFWNKRSKEEPRKTFRNSKNYWMSRYEKGGNSGSGSYGELAAFKGKVINEFAQEKHLDSIIELGCGDGNNLQFYPKLKYLGFDISPHAIEICKKRYISDPTKTFFLMQDYRGQKAELAMSLDVIYHLIEDDVYHNYMHILFGASSKYVMIYSSNTDEQFPDTPPHIKNRCFSSWIDRNHPNFRLIKHIPNRYPYAVNSQIRSRSDFFIYEKT